MHTIKSKAEDLWRHSRDLLKAPLLKKLQQDQELFEKAVIMFNHIMKVSHSALIILLKVNS